MTSSAIVVNKVGATPLDSSRREKTVHLPRQDIGSTINDLFTIADEMAGLLSAIRDEARADDFLVGEIYAGALGLGIIPSDNNTSSQLVLSKRHVTGRGSGPTAIPFYVSVESIIMDTRNNIVFLDDARDRIVDYANQISELAPLLIGELQTLGLN